jgi:hypothetical protein
MGANQARIRKAGWDIDRGLERQRDHRPDAGDRHQPPAQRVVPHQVQHPLVQNIVLHLQRLVRHQQGAHHRG